MTVKFVKDYATGNLKLRLPYDGQVIRIEVSPDIASHGGMKGPGTTVHIWTPNGLRGYHGAFNLERVWALLRRTA